MKAFKKFRIEEDNEELSEATGLSKILDKIEKDAIKLRKKWEAEKKKLISGGDMINYDWKDIK